MTISSTGAIVRRLDHVGRLVLPRELLRTMDIAAGDLLEFHVDGGTLSLRKHEPGCVFCRGTQALIAFRGRKVCRHCMRALTPPFPHA
jgi:transcriptional pleiotropic regulator of transition state genes